MAHGVRSLVFALAAVGLVGSGCTPWRDAEWRELSLGTRVLEDAWEGTVNVAAKDGFTLDISGTDRGKHVLLSRWRTRAVPFRGSVRRRLHGEFTRPGEDLPWVLRYYFERQIIRDVSGGFDPAEDDWSADGQDAETEELLAAKLNLHFHGLMPTETTPAK